VGAELGQVGRRVHIEEGSGIAGCRLPLFGADEQGVAAVEEVPQGTPPRPSCPAGRRVAQTVGIYAGVEPVSPPYVP